MRVRLAALLAIVVVGVLLVMGNRANGNGQADATQSPSVASNSSGGSEPTPSADPSGLLNSMVSDLATKRGYHIVFSGSDLSGPVDFDLTTDGSGNLTGSYNRQGLPADIVISAGVFYMRGNQATGSYTGLRQPTSVSGWIRIPSWIDPGILGTIARPSKLQSCVRTMIALSPAPYEVRGTKTINGTATLLLGRAGADNKAWPAEYAVAASGTPRLITWDYLTTQNGAIQASECNNDSAAAMTGPASGPTGIFTFTGLATAPTITAPIGAVDLANPDPAALAGGGVAP